MIAHYGETTTNMGLYRRWVPSPYYY